MVEIEFLGPIKMHNLKLEAANLSEVKEKLGEYAQLKEWLKICAVAVNDEIASGPGAKGEGSGRIRAFCAFAR